MTLNRWDPLRDLLNFQERVNRFIDHRTEGDLCRLRARWSPVMDVLETPDAYILKVELAGVGKKNINIEIQGRRLKIFGDLCTEESDSQLAAYHTVERSHGPFERSVDLPTDADVGRSEARYEDGLLQIHIPKSQEERERILTVVTLR